MSTVEDRSARYQTIIAQKRARAEQLEKSATCSKVFFSPASSFFIAEKDDKNGVLNKSGNWVVPCIYNSCSYSDGEIILIENNGKLGLFLNGLLVDPDYDEIIDEGDDRVSVCKEGVWGYLRIDGTFVEKCVFEEEGCEILLWGFQA